MLFFFTITFIKSILLTVDCLLVASSKSSSMTESWFYLTGDCGTVDRYFFIESKGLFEGGNSTVCVCFIINLRSPVTESLLSATLLLITSELAPNVLECRSPWGDFPGDMSDLSSRVDYWAWTVCGFRGFSAEIWLDSSNCAARVSPRFLLFRLAAYWRFLYEHILTEIKKTLHINIMNLWVYYLRHVL